MFKDAEAFAQYKIRSWDVSQVTKFREMFDGDIPFQNHFGIGDTPSKDFFGKMTNEKLKTAMAAYFDNKTTAIEKYGYIYLFDTSEVTSMKGLFRDQPTFTGVYNATINNQQVNVENITVWNMDGTKASPYSNTGVSDCGSMCLDDATCGCRGRGSTQNSFVDLMDTDLRYCPMKNLCVYQ